MANSLPPCIIELVDALIAAGCDIWAVGTRYSIGEPEDEPAASEVRRILAEFGPREEYLEEISAYLRSRGRIIILDDVSPIVRVME